MAKSPRAIKTAAQAIDALGGPRAVAELFGITRNAVCNWRSRGLPGALDVYETMAPRLRKAGHRFDERKLFGRESGG